jgi:hypothetical protein
MEISKAAAQNSVVLNVLRSMALLASLMNAFIFCRIKQQDSLYKYLLVVAIFDGLYTGFKLTLCAANTIYFAYGKMHEHGAQFAFFYLNVCVFINEYLTSVFTMFNILMEVYVTMQRIFLISNISYNRHFRSVRFGHVCSCLLACSVLMYTPILFTNRVEIFSNNSNETTNASVAYKIEHTEFGVSRARGIFHNWMSLIRIVLVSVVLFGLNLTAIHMHRSFLNTKKKLSVNKSKLKFSNSTIINIINLFIWEKDYFDY